MIVIYLLLALLLSPHIIDAKSFGKIIYEHECSDDYITRWAFQELCDHVYDPRDYAFPTKEGGGATFNPSSVEPGDIIFVRNFDKFMREMNHLIKHPYIIVTHGEMDETNHRHQQKFLRERKIIARFTIHPFKTPYPKNYALPLGVQPLNKTVQERNALEQKLRSLRHTSEKKTLLYVNVREETYGGRKGLNELFAHKPFCKYSDRVPFDRYLIDVAEAKFVLSPRGSGPDSYRTWEALLLGAIPIVQRGMWGHGYEFDREPRPQHTMLDDLYKNLPVLVIDNWTQVTEAFLTKKWEEITSKKYDIRPLYMSYWKEKIFNVRDGFLRRKKR